jgi:ubiquinone/menaquinone biosynthesis C-methylase UbiE
MMNEKDAWSLYWANKHLNSCISNEYQEDQLILERCWTDFIEPLESRSKVVDLATGNGSVLMCLAKYRSDIEYIGVDYAQLSPESHFIDELRDCVSFITNTDIAHLPFESESVDAITSQFGFEYSDVSKSTGELLRVLKPEGSFQLILHHSGGEIIKSSLRRKRELELLLSPEGIIKAVNNYVEGNIDLASLEAAGQSFIAQYSTILSDGITGQVFTVINEVITLKEDYTNSKEAKAQFKTLLARVTGEDSRLSQLTKASLSRQDVGYIMSQLSSNVNELELTLIKPYQAEDKILAWLLTGKKIKKKDNNDR